MPVARVGEVDLAWESFGSGRPMLLVMGIGSQMVLWHVAFCEMLAARGFRVIRFDHRDVGLSSRMDHLGRPSVRRNIVRRLIGRRVVAPYGLHDMADDTAGLLGALGMDRAHVVGASMGGMIGQLLAIRHPERVGSFVSIMSSPGGVRNLIGDPRASLALLRRPGPGREAWIEHFVSLFTTLSPVDRTDPEDLRRVAAECWDRGIQKDAWFRHLAALLSARDRTQALAGVRAPTLVIHGTVDPLVPLRAGKATADAIPGARFLPVEGMGHSLPKSRWPFLVDAIASHAAAAEGSGTANPS